MRKYRFILLSIAASLFLSAGLLAQEQVEVSVKVTKDGKVVKDTTYQFDDASEAKHAMKMMEVMSGDDEHMEYITKKYTSAHSGSGEAKTMVFISEDGEKTEIKEILTELIDEYIERHKETLDLLSRPEWVEAISRGKAEVESGAKGKSLDELAD